jgi:hypothetical protein
VRSWLTRVRPGRSGPQGMPAAARHYALRPPYTCGVRLYHHRPRLAVGLISPQLSCRLTHIGTAVATGVLACCACTAAYADADAADAQSPLEDDDAQLQLENAAPSPLTGKAARSGGEDYSGGSADAGNDDETEGPPLAPRRYDERELREACRQERERALASCARALVDSATQRQADLVTWTGEQHSVDRRRCVDSAERTRQAVSDISDGAISDAVRIQAAQADAAIRHRVALRDGAELRLQYELLCIAELQLAEIYRASLRVLVPHLDGALLLSVLRNMQEPGSCRINRSSRSACSCRGWQVPSVATCLSFSTRNLWLPLWSSLWP